MPVRRVESPGVDRQETALRAAGLEPRYHRSENFFACRLPGAGRDFAVNVLVRSDIVELVLSLRTPVGIVGPTFHGAARTLMERAQPWWRHDPRFPRVPFGADRPFEATVHEVAALIRDVHAAVVAS